MALLDKDRGDLASLFCGNVCKLLQLLGANLSEISEQQNERELDPASGISTVVNAMGDDRTSPWSS